MQRYLKFLAQLVATLFVALIAALADDRIDTAEWVNVALAVLGTVGVLGAGNFSVGVWAYSKVIVSAATAGLMTLNSFLVDGGQISMSEWLQIGVAVIGALTVLVVKGPIVAPVTDPSAVGPRGVA
jgi:hypothetical protein